MQLTSRTEQKTIIIVHRKSHYNFYIKTIEMVINSEGREIKYSLGIKKVQFALLVEATIWEFFNLEGIFS